MQYNFPSLTTGSAVANENSLCLSLNILNAAGKSQVPSPKEQSE